MLFALGLQPAKQFLMFSGYSGRRKGVSLLEAGRSLVSDYLTDEYMEMVNQSVLGVSVALFSTDPFDVRILMAGNAVLSCRVSCNDHVGVIQNMIQEQLGELLSQVVRVILCCEACKPQVDGATIIVFG